MTRYVDQTLEERRAYNRKKTAEYVARNREQVNERAKDRLRRRGALLRDFKAAYGCRDCGERDPVVLELDHLDPATKDRRSQGFKRTGVPWRSLSMADLKEELKKCDVVCANCHRRRSAEQFEWANYMASEPE